MKKLSLLFVCISLFLHSNLLHSEQWSRSNGNNESHRYALDSQINSSNVVELSKVFSFKFGHIYEGLTVQSSPIFTGNKLIINALEHVSAVNPENGQLIWQTELGTFALNRGLTYDKKNSIIFRPTNQGVYEIDANSGKVLHIYENLNSSLAPIVFENTLLVATLDAGIISIDIDSRKKNWQTSFEMNGYKARVWSGFSIDPVSDLAFVVTGSSGGITGWWRNDPNLEVTLIAVNIKSGEIVWTFQHIEHDIWDLDLVGSPILLDLEVNEKQYRAVAALSKTGDIILLNAINGEPIHKNSFEIVDVPQSDLPGEKTALMQKKFSKPEPFWSTVVNLENDFSHLDGENLEYVKNKLRHSKSGFFLPPSINYDLVMYGIHGGAEWFGGAIDFSSQNPSLIVPYNRNSWILRAYYTNKLSILIDRMAQKINAWRNDSESSIAKPAWVPWDRPDDAISELSNKIYSYVPFTPENEVYENQCASCHGVSRRGFYEFEGQGDLFYPPLVGSTLSKKREFIMDFEKVSSLHKSHDIPFNISKESHAEIFESFDRYDEFLLKFGLLSNSGFWQVLLDKDRNPATKPPWGGMAKIDLVSGKKLWDIPLGQRLDSDGNLIAKGDIVFGGVLTTASGLIFATGNPDGAVYAFDSNGKMLWQDFLPYAGSAPPMTYTYNGCQYVVFIATGGRFVDFNKKGNGDFAEVYRLDSCKPKN